MDKLREEGDSLLYEILLLESKLIILKEEAGEIAVREKDETTNKLIQLESRLFLIRNVLGE